MPKIKQLPQHEAQKIAAGEVVERPANIVKELIENSIDAGAKTITIYIEDAGKKCIRIVDNGCGMDEHDARICFDRHATSKITHVDDLETINTFGFRGEALASIASVSEITLITKEQNAQEGTQVILSGGAITELTPVACKTGTDITIANLFFNVPARKKFLKSTDTEWRAIQQLFNAFCFDYPHIRFTLFNNNKQVNNHPQTDSLHKRALQLWDPTLNQHLLTVEKKDDSDIVIEGIISDHQHYRYDKSNMYFFVNKRWIKNYQLTNALIKGYANVIPEGRCPIAAIHITVPAHEVDINIHPRKEEVKFLHPRRVEQALQQLVKTTLEQNLSRHIKKEITFEPSTLRYSQGERFNHMPSHSTFNPFNFDAFFSAASSQTSSTSTASVDIINSDTAAETSPEKTTQEEHVQLSVNASARDILNTQPFAEIETYNILGQYNKTYILVEKEEGLFLVDQHAAHERILYEVFSNRFEEIATVQLLFPQTITLSKDDIEIILPHIELFTTNGIVLEQCSPEQLLVQSLPVHLKNLSLESLIKEAIGWIIEYKTLDTQEFKKTIHNKLRAQMACKAAVKAGDELTHEKMTQLLIDLDKTANRLTCPHGRPTGWLMSLHEIEKKLKRKL